MRKELLMVNRWWKDPMVIFTALLFLSTAIYAAATIALWIETRDNTAITRRTFELTNRPYVGVLGARIKIDNANKVFTLEIDIKNHGPIPARNVTVKNDMLINSVSQPLKSIPVKPMTIFPESTITSRPGTVGSTSFPSVIDGSAALEFMVKIQYKGVMEEIHSTDEKWRYDAENRFFHLTEAEYK